MSEVGLVPSGIVVRSAVKVYPGTRNRVLDGVDLSIRRGEFVSLIGPSGCGKTTLLRTMAGLLPLDGGSVSLFGEEPAVACRHKHIGFVPQSPALLPRRTVRDNVRLPMRVNRRVKTPFDADATAHAERLLTEMGLDGKGCLRPHQISGGMQQRVAIARAFMVDGPVLLMDEPFSAVDELTRESLRHVLLKAWDGTQKTVVFVTHSVPEAVILSDRVVVMAPNPGRIHSEHLIDLPRPRDEDIQLSSGFAALAAKLRNDLNDAWSGGVTHDDH